MDRKLALVILGSLVEIVIALTLPLWVLTGTTGLVFALVVFLYHDEIKRLWAALTRRRDKVGIKVKSETVLYGPDGKEKDRRESEE